MVIVLVFSRTLTFVFTFTRTPCSQERLVPKKKKPTKLKLLLLLEREITRRKFLQLKEAAESDHNDAAEAKVLEKKEQHSPTEAGVVATATSDAEAGEIGAVGSASGSQDKYVSLSLSFFFLSPFSHAFPAYTLLVLMLLFLLLLSC